MENHHKRKRDEAPGSPLAAANGGGEMDLSLLEAVEKAQNGGVEVLDLRALKKLVLSFERRLRDNLEGRMKYPVHKSSTRDCVSPSPASTSPRTKGR